MDIVIVFGVGRDVVGLQACQESRTSSDLVPSPASVLPAGQPTHCFFCVRDAPLYSLLYRLFRICTIYSGSTTVCWSDEFSQRNEMSPSSPKISSTQKSKTTGTKIPLDKTRILPSYSEWRTGCWSVSISRRVRSSGASTNHRRLRHRRSNHRRSLDDSRSNTTPSKGMHGSHPQTIWSLRSVQYRSRHHPRWHPRHHRPYSTHPNFILLDLLQVSDDLKMISNDLIWYHPGERDMRWRMRRGQRGRELCSNTFWWWDSPPTPSQRPFPGLPRSFSPRSSTSTHPRRRNRKNQLLMIHSAYFIEFLGVQIF